MYISVNANSHSRQLDQKSVILLLILINLIIVHQKHPQFVARNTGTHGVSIEANEFDQLHATSCMHYHSAFTAHIFLFLFSTLQVAVKEIMKYIRVFLLLVIYLGIAHRIDSAPTDMPSQSEIQPIEAIDASLDHNQCTRIPMNEPILLTTSGNTDELGQMNRGMTDELAKLIEQIPPIGSNQFRKFLEKLKAPQIRLIKIVTQCGVQWFLMLSLFGIIAAGTGAGFGAALVDSQYEAASCEKWDSRCFYCSTQCTKTWPVFETISRKSAVNIGAIFGAVAGAAWIGFGLTAQTANLILMGAKYRSAGRKFMEPIVGAGLQGGATYLMFKTLSTLNVGLPSLQLEKAGLIMAAFDAGAVFFRNLGGSLSPDTHVRLGYFLGSLVGWCLQWLSLAYTSHFFKKSWTENNVMESIGAGAGALHAYLAFVYLWGLFSLQYWRTAKFLPAIESTRPPALEKIDWESHDVRSPFILIRNSEEFEKTADCQVYLVGKTGQVDAVFPAHKIVLMSSSPIYNSIIVGVGLWKGQDYLVESDVSKEALKAYLEFFYLGDINLNPPDAPVGYLRDLIYLSGKNMVESLQFKIRSYLWEQKTPVVALYVWRLAQLDNVDEKGVNLSKALFNYISQHPDATSTTSQLDFIEETKAMFTKHAHMTEERVRLLAMIPVRDQTALPLYDLFFHISAERFSDRLDYIANFMAGKLSKFMDVIEAEPQNFRHQDLRLFLRRRYSSVLNTWIKNSGDEQV